MRVLMTTDTVGGVWTFTEELTEGLLAAGCAVALVSLGREPSAAQRRWTEEVRASVRERFEFRSLATPLEWMDDNAQAFSGAEAELEALAHTFRAEVVHANQFCFGALDVHLPVIVTAHSDVLSWARACRGDSLPESAWLRQYRTLVQCGLDRAALVTAPTRWMLEALRSGFRLPRANALVPNGCTLDRVPERQRTMQAVSAGRFWDEGKNLRLLAEIHAPMPIVVAGEVVEAALPGYLRFAGALGRDALHALFAESALYVCPSLYEPFGLAPLEAAICGCGVLAREIPSLREVWGDAAEYFSTATELERLLNELSADASGLASLQARSRERALGFSRERMTAEYLRVYREALGASEERSLAA